MKFEISNSELSWKISDEFINKYINACIYLDNENLCVDDPFIVFVFINKDSKREYRFLSHLFSQSLFILNIPNGDYSVVAFVLVRNSYEFASYVKEVCLGDVYLGGAHYYRDVILQNGELDFSFFIEKGLYVCEDLVFNFDVSVNESVISLENIAYVKPWLFLWQPREINSLYVLTFRLLYLVSIKIWLILIYSVFMILLRSVIYVLLLLLGFIKADPSPVLHPFKRQTCDMFRTMEYNVYYDGSVIFKPMLLSVASAIVYLFIKSANISFPSGGDAYLIYAGLPFFAAVAVVIYFLDENYRKKHFHETFIKNVSSSPTFNLRSFVRKLNLTKLFSKKVKFD